jgi:hypothetical protein
MIVPCSFFRGYDLRNPNRYVRFIFCIIIIETRTAKSFIVAICFSSFVCGYVADYAIRTNESNPHSDTRIRTWTNGYHSLAMMIPERFCARTSSRWKINQLLPWWLPLGDIVELTWRWAKQRLQKWTRLVTLKKRKRRNALVCDFWASIRTSIC